MNKTVKLGLVQMSCSDDVAENFDKAVGYARQAAGQGANIVCLQELFRSRYFAQVEDHTFFGLAETLDEGSGTLQRLKQLAAELEIVLVAGLFERRAMGIYHNVAVVFDADGSYLGKYRKMHIPDDPGYYEKFYFTPGDLGFRVFHTRYGKIGVLICWDQWFPESARMLALSGAQIILQPSIIPIAGQSSQVGRGFVTSVNSLRSKVFLTHFTCSPLFSFSSNSRKRSPRPVSAPVKKPPESSRRAIQAEQNPRVSTKLAQICSINSCLSLTRLMIWLTFLIDLRNRFSCFPLASARLL